MRVPLTPRQIRDVLWFAAFTAAYFLAVRYGVAFIGQTPSPFWFPDAVLLCALLKTKPRNWWIVLLPILPIRLYLAWSLPFPLWFILATVALDVSRSIAGALILRRVLVNPIRLGTVREFLVFLLVAAIGLPALSGFAAGARCGRLRAPRIGLPRP